MATEKLTLWTGTGLPDGSPGLLVRILTNTDHPTVLVGFTLTPEEILAALRGAAASTSRPQEHSTMTEMNAAEKGQRTRLVKEVEDRQDRAEHNPDSIYHQVMADRAESALLEFDKAHDGTYEQITPASWS